MVSTNQQPRGRLAPSTLKRKIDQIEKAARRLLHHLGISDAQDASDGPADEAIFDALMFVNAQTEDDIVRDTARVGRLVEVFEAIGAAIELERLAKAAGKEVTRVGTLTEHHGDFAVHVWTELMADLYRNITGKAPKTSVAAPGSKNRGIAQGPFIRFLMAAGEPLGIDLAEDAWRSRFRTTQKANIIHQN